MSRPKPTVLLDDYGVYCLVDPNTNVAFYVGMSSHRNRPYEHLTEAISGKFSHKNYAKINNIKSIFEQGFEPNVIWLRTGLSRQEAIELEINAIRLFGRIANGGCLTNATDGGDGFSGPHTPESRAFISLALTNRDPEIRRKAAEKFSGEHHPRPLLGTTRTDDQKLAASIDMKLQYEDGRRAKRDMSGENNPFFGLIHSEESRASMSKSKSQIYQGDGNPFYGKTHTEASRIKISINNGSKRVVVQQKISAAMKGKPWSEARRQAYLNKKNTGV